VEQEQFDQLMYNYEKRKAIAQYQLCATNFGAQPKQTPNTGSPKLPCPHLDNVGGCCKTIGHLKCTCVEVNRQLRANA
jgi:hypothetical protein